MSTETSSRILRSSHSKRLQAIPWETFLHIFSYCDQPTLVAVSLVSFGCWELAGPILYQDVEIIDLDGLASLFFIEIIPSSPRLQQATSLLSRIKTLTLNIQSWKQHVEPFFLDSRFWDEDEEDSGPFDSSHLPPHRLLAFTDEPLPLQHLILPDWLHPTERLQDYLPSSVFPYLNPRHLTHRLDRSSPTLCHVGCMFSPCFLPQWTNLQQIATQGEDPVCMYEDEDGIYRESLLISIWARIPQETRREIVYLFDFTAAPFPFLERIRSFHGGAPRSLERALDHRHELQEVAALVDLTVVLRVREGEDGRVAREEVSKLEGWLKKLVRVETV